MTQPIEARGQFLQGNESRIVLSDIDAVAMARKAVALFRPTSRRIIHSPQVTFIPEEGRQLRVVSNEALLVSLVQSALHQSVVSIEDADAMGRGKSGDYDDVIDHGFRGHIEVDMGEENRGVVIAVTNNGQGIGYTMQEYGYRTEKEEMPLAELLRAAAKHEGWLRGLHPKDEHFQRMQEAADRIGASVFIVHPRNAKTLGLELGIVIPRDQAPTSSL